MALDLFCSVNVYRPLLQVYNASEDIHYDRQAVLIICLDVYAH